MRGGSGGEKGVDSSQDRTQDLIDLAIVDPEQSWCAEFELHAAFSWFQRLRASLGLRKPRFSTSHCSL